MSITYRLFKLPVSPSAGTKRTTAPDVVLTFWHKQYRGPRIGTDVVPLCFQGQLESLCEDYGQVPRPYHASAMRCPILT